MSSILDGRPGLAAVIEQVAEVTGYLWQKGWAERNGGNISWLLDNEEVGEYHRDKTPEELADILEVVYALAATLGCSREELERIYQEKHHMRGGFEQRLFLISTE